MASLKNRQSQIPNGLKFSLPEVGYTSAPYASFDTILNTVDNIVRANPGKARAAGWPTSREEIAHWIDDFNARICIANGWNDYVTGTPEDTPPKHGPPPGRPAALAAGARANAEFILSGQTPVDSNLAAGRAAVCVSCPLNKAGDLSNFFERATAEMLRKSIEALNDIRMKTPHDSYLGVCDACYCPMKLKVWYPLKFIRSHMNEETMAALHENCWIKNESDSTGSD